MRNALCIAAMLLTATAAAAQSNPPRGAAAQRSTPAPSPPPAPVAPPVNNSACEAIARTVELNLKTLGQDYADADLTKSAAQATQVANETANDLAILKINLDLLAANRCTPWSRPVGLMNYGGAALACARAVPADKAALCDQDSWKAAF